MNTSTVRVSLLTLLIMGITVLYIPFSDDPFRSFRETLFQAVAAGFIFLHLAFPGGNGAAAERNPAFRYALWLFGAAAAGMAASLFINGATPLGAMTAANFLFAGVLFIALYGALTRERSRFWLALFFTAAFLNATLGVTQFFGYDPFFKSMDPSFHSLYHRYRVGGFLDSPNMLAPFLASFAPYLLVVFLIEENGVRAATAGAGLALLLAPVALAKNLAAIAGLAVVMPVLLAWFTLRLKTRRSARLALCWLAAAITAVFVFAAYNAEDETTKLLRAHSRDERMAQNRAAMMMFADSPAAGKGPGFFFAHFVEYRRAVWFGHPPLRLPDRPAHQTHNDYAQLLAEGGLLAGLPVFGLLLLWSFLQAKFFRGAWSAATVSAREAALAGSAGGFWIIAVNALGSFPFHVATLAVTALFWGALAARQLEEPADG
ncbi:MAG: O-antigen ligase family protein [Nitrospinae bacterium]|nr:O-antigen ligase family protein [Nitrospinota bacterium]